MLTRKEPGSFVGCTKGSLVPKKFSWAKGRGMKTSNIQHRTPNIEVPARGHSAFGVRCWMFDVPTKKAGDCRPLRFEISATPDQASEILSPSFSVTIAFFQSGA